MCVILILVLAHPGSCREADLSLKSSSPAAAIVSPKKELITIGHTRSPVASHAIPTNAGPHHPAQPPHPFYKPRRHRNLSVCNSRNLERHRPYQPYERKPHSVQHRISPQQR